MSAEFNFESSDESDTDRLGAAPARVLPVGAVVALIGTLGAGKTRLVQAVARAVGIDPREVVSPTFVLVHEYEISPSRKAGVLPNANPGLPAGANQTPSVTAVSTIYHLDAYRIKDDDEFRELGPEEFFESEGWTFIEWADRVAGCLPSDYLQIAIEVIAPTARRFTLSVVGNRFGATIEAIRAASAA